MSIFLRDYKNANRFQPNQVPPRLNFNGFVEFAFSNEAQVLASQGSAPFREQISSLLQTATLPSASFTTQVKKQYNIKRIIQTGVEYNPVEISVIDTINNEWVTLIMKYMSFYYMNPRNKTSGSDRDTTFDSYKSNREVVTTPSTFMTENTFDSNAAGLNLTEDAAFIDHIKMVVYHGGRGTEYIIFKPIITSFQMGEIDYASSDVRKFQLSFDYENFVVNGKTNFKLSPEDLARFETVPGGFSFVQNDSDANPIYKGTDGTPFPPTGDYPRTGQKT
jgi:hypothetical protein